MLDKYRRRVRALPAAAAAALREELEIDPEGPRDIVRALEGSGLGSADVVLALLRRGLLAHATAVAGVPVQRVPGGGPPRVPKLAAVPARTGDERRVVEVERPYPGKPGPGADRYSALRRNMTVRAALARGVTRRDLRRWQRRTWVWLEE